MATTDKSKLTALLTGSDLWWHKIALAMKGSMHLFVIFTLIFGVIFSPLVYFFVSELGLEYVITYLDALISHSDTYVSTVNAKGGDLTLTAHDMIRALNGNDTFLKAISQIGFFALIAAGVGAVVVVMMLKHFVVSGKENLKDKFLRGQKIVTHEELAELTSKEELSPISIGKVVFPMWSLFVNFLFMGSMGKGKSQAMFPVAFQFREWGKKMVIYDKTGEYTQRLYRDGKDFILSVTDARSVAWSIFSDLKKQTDPAMVAAFFVPDDDKNMQWVTGARAILADLLIIYRSTGGSMKDVLDMISLSTIEDIYLVLQGAGAVSAGFMDPASEKTAASYRATLLGSPAIQFFKYFKDTKAQFSVREFMHREDDACLFLTSNATLDEVTSPFIAAWIELLVTEGLSMPPTDQTKYEVRCALFLDEIVNLPKLRVMKPLLTQARKYGFVTLVGIQGDSFLEEIYGKNLAKGYIGNLQNKFILGLEEAETAKNMSDTLGKEELEEVNVSKSFGAEENRDGVNLGTKRVEYNLVSPTELLTLPKLTGWLKLSGDYPIAKITLQGRGYEDIAEGYIERDGMDLEDVVFQTPKPKAQAKSEEVADISDMAEVDAPQEDPNRPW